MGLFSHHQSGSTRLAGIQIQTSLLGVPLAIGWGRTKVGCNLIDYVDFRATPHSSSSSGGKGLGGGGGGPSYTYTASVIMALCGCQISGIVSVYKDSSVRSSLSAAGLDGFMPGSMTQTPWPYLVSAHPDHALNYHGIAYVYAQNYQLSGDASLSNHSFEVDFSIQVGGGVHDANARDILVDFFTNPRYGVSGWGAGLLDNWDDYANYCLASNLLLSPLLDTQTTGSDFLQRILEETNSDCLWSEGVLKIRPLGDSSVMANGVTWTPNMTPVYDLTDDDFLGEVVLEIQDQSQAKNMVQIEYLNRANQYQATPVTANDLNDIVTFGLRKEDPKQFHDICDGVIARTIAQLWLQRQLFVRDLYHFDLPMDFIGLEELDYVTLTTRVDGIVLNRKLVRVNSIDQDEEGQDTLHFTAEDVPGATASAALYAAHTGSGFAPDPDADPGSVSAPLLINTPQSLTASGYELWAAVAGIGAAWGGAVVWASFDNVNYSQVGVINGPARYGVLSASLANHADPDGTDTLSVDLTVSGGTLSSVTTAEADKGVTLSWVGGELVSYATATLTAASKYDLTYLRRGQQGSSPASHATGVDFAKLDSAIFKFAYLPQHVGKTVYLKFQSFNSQNRGLQDISVCTAYSVVLGPTASLPYASPSGLGLAGGGSTWVGDTIHMICDPVPLATSYRFDFYRSDGVTLCRSINSANPECFFTALQALLDANGVQRTYKIAVTPSTALGAGPTSSQVTITNAAPAAVSGVSASGGSFDGTVSCTASTDTDLVGYVVFYSNTSGFNPRTQGSVALSGIPSVDISGLPAGTYYAIIAAFDPWSSDPNLLNLSAQQSFTITTGGGSTPTGGGGSGGGGSGGYTGRVSF